MNLSVIIPSRMASNLIPCVAAVRRHEPEVRIVIVDDSPDLSLRPKPDWMPAVAIEVLPVHGASSCAGTICQLAALRLSLLSAARCSLQVFTLHKSK